MDAEGFSLGAKEDKLGIRASKFQENYYSISLSKLIECSYIDLFYT